MNIKAQEMWDYLTNNLKVPVRRYDGDKSEGNLVYLVISGSMGREFVLRFDDTDIVGGSVAIVSSLESVDKFPGLFRLFNTLNAKYTTHTYKLDQQNNLVVSFAYVAAEAKFDPDVFYNFCALIDYWINSDIAVIRDFFEAALGRKNQGLDAFLAKNGER